MLLLPTTLSRKAVASTFNKLTPVAWEKHFEREHHNGIAKLRADGEDARNRIYYSTDGLIKWLIRSNFYSFEETRCFYYQAPKPHITQHILAG